MRVGGLGLTGFVCMEEAGAGAIPEGPGRGPERAAAPRRYVGAPSRRAGAHGRGPRSKGPTS